MNVKFDEISAQDAARMIGVDYTTITGWCRRNLINYVNVSDGVTKARYKLTSKEVEHLRELSKKHGHRKILLYYKKDWDITMGDNNNEVKDIEYTYQPIAEQPKEEKVEEPKKKFDLDSITTTISYMQDIKERLEDIEAEKNQLLNEYAELKKEVMDSISL